MKTPEVEDERILAVAWTDKESRGYIDLIPASSLLNPTHHQIYHHVAGPKGGAHGAEATVRRSDGQVELTYLGGGINAREEWFLGTMRLKGILTDSPSADWKPEGANQFKEAAAVATWLPPEASIGLARLTSDLVEIVCRTKGKTEIQRLITARLGQGEFRQRLIQRWNGRCAVTDLAIPELLRASHIKAWRDCETDDERLSADNGLLLAAHIDALFDRHLLSFDQDGTPAWSAKISTTDRRALVQKARLKIPAASLPFMHVHRSMLRH